MWHNFNKEYDQIILISPGNGKRKSHLVNESIIKFQEMGYKITNVSSDMFDSNNNFHSNDDGYRYNHLISAINDSSFKAIWCLAGGYGSAKLIDRLKLLPCPAQEKIFIGFSDITALHLFFNKNWNWHTIHGPAFIQVLDNISNTEMVINLIEKKLPPLAIALNLLNDKKITETITGKLIGGNLALVQNSIGTDWEIQTDEKIVFLEDVNEPGYKVDRTLLHLEQAGIFDKVKAVIFGEFSFDEAKNDLREKDLIEYALNEFAKRMNFPVFKTEKFGHGKFNIPIVEGALGFIEFEDMNYKFYYELS